MISINTLIILFISVLLTSIISGIIGMGGGALLLAVMTFYYTLDVIVPIHGIIQLSANSSRTFMLRKNLNWKLILPLVIGTCFGMFLAVMIKKTTVIDDKYPLSIVVLLISYVVFKPKKMPQIKIPFWAFSIVGFFTGLMAIFVGAIGPFLAVFFIRDDLTKEEIVSNKSFSQMILHLLKIPSFIYLGFDYIGYISVWGPMILATFIGTYIGVNALGKMNEELFRKIFKVTLFVAGVKILHKILFT